MSPEGSRRLLRPRLLAGAVLFVLSGGASLMDQVVWLRLLSLIFGNTTHAAATLLAVFMGGLGLGALAFGRWADRMARPLVGFALVETGVGVIALLSPTLLDTITQSYVHLYGVWGSHPTLFALGRVVLAALILLPPTILMGGTLPLLLRGLSRDDEEALGGVTGVLYAVNTLGAVLGTALAGFVTIRLIGLRGTLALAAAGNFLAALGCLALSRPRSVTPAAREPARIPRGYLALFFAMGATSLAFEVLWTRVLVFYLGSSVYAYSLMLVLFLMGVGLGSLAAAPWIDRLRQPLVALGALELGIAFFAVLQVIGFQKLNAVLAAWARLFELSSFSVVLFTQLLAVLPILGPPTFLMGVSFPLAVRLVAGGPERAGRDVGRVYAANTLGAVAGSLLAGFLLIPLLGTQNSLVTIAALNAALGAGILLVASASRWRRAALLAPLAVLASLFVFVPDQIILGAGLFRLDRPGDLVEFSEDASTSVTVRRQRSPSGPYLSLELNGVNVAGTSPDLYAVQMMQGHLPMLLGREPRSVAHIGFGSGGTAYAVSRHPVESILVVEISPPVLAAADRHFRNVNHGVLGDPRVSVEINDGRNFLLATRQSFDALLSDSIHPRYAGNGSLYSEDYFAIARQRLRPGGVISMWLPMYTLTTRNFAMILRAFQEVFPNTVVWYEPSALNSFTIVTGRLEAGGWDAETLRAAFAQPTVRSELEQLGIREPGDLLASYLAGGETLSEWLEQFPSHIDDLPSVEYESGTLRHSIPTWRSTFAALLKLRPEEAPREFLDALEPEARERANWQFRGRRRLLEQHLSVLDRNLRGEKKKPRSTTR